MLFQSLQEKFVSDTTKSVLAFDSTAPGYPMETGSRHPISIVLNQIIDIFKRIGFTIAEDREIEDDWHNFTALNTPDDHPARDNRQRIPSALQQMINLSNQTQ